MTILSRKALARLTVLGLTEAMQIGTELAEKSDLTEPMFNDAVWAELNSLDLSMNELAGALGEIIGAILVTSGILLSTHREEYIPILQDFSLREASKDD